MLTIEFYYEKDGTCPVKEFLDSLDPKLKVKTLRTIMLLEEFGNELRMPYSEPLNNGIFELLSIFGTKITRVLYFFVESNTAVLTHGLIKKTQKMPKSELERAYSYREDYYI